MTTSLYFHEACHGHVTPEGHPERVQRLHAVMDVLAGAEFDNLLRIEAPRANLEDVVRAHPQTYIARIEEAARLTGDRPRRLDADTSICHGSWEASLRAAGAVVSAVDAVMSGATDNAFCAVRPPGHHAEAEIPMGFCLFNSIAIAALHARETYGLEKVAVLDFDVHHGNGTAAILADKPECFFASSHQMPLYPGTGYSDETGCGNTLNVPLAPDTGSEVFREEWEEKIFPALEAFGPDFILVSAGFDGHRCDPLANLNLEDEDYAWITREILARGQGLCQGRVVSTLEGGYDLDALQSATAAHVGELLKA